MGSNGFDYLRNLQKGRTDWKIKVRVLREWRGVTPTGALFKGYNILLLDAKNVRMTAYVPEWLTDTIKKMFTMGKIYAVSNFQVKINGPNDKWRAVNNDKHIQFTTQTRATELEETEYFIAHNHFDFYDLGELKALANQQLLLADVVGVVLKREDIKTVRNSKFNTDQLQLRMKITDGRNKINVILWDKLAEEFQHEVDNKQLEQPLILILAAGRVGRWKEETDICNFSPSTYYINYNHHSVVQLRKMISQTNFEEQHSATAVKRKALKQFSVEQVKLFNERYIGEEVICQVKIKLVEDNEEWFYPRCTTCYRQLQLVDKKHICIHCKRIVPHPDKKFGICVMAEDSTGPIEIILMDRPIRSLFGFTVFEIEKKYNGDYPTIMKQLENKDFTLKLQILEVNIQKKSDIYLAIDCFPGFTFDHPIGDEDTVPQPTEQYTAQTSGSGVSYHLDKYSQIQG